VCEAGCPTAGLQNVAGGIDAALDALGAEPPSSAGGAGVGAVGAAGAGPAEGVGSMGVPSIAGALPQVAQPCEVPIITVCPG